MSPRTLLILFFAVAAVVEDLSRRQISNWTSGGALLSGLILHLALKGWPGLWHSLLGAAIGFGVFLIFYLLGGMGGGDVKLMAGFGALLGDKRIMPAALMAAIMGGLMAAGYLGVKAVWKRLRPRPDAPAPPSRESIPYAPAIAAGVWLALISEV